VALPNGLNGILNAGSIDAALNQGSIDDRLTKGQQDLHKDSSLWPKFTSNKELKALLDDVKGIRTSTKDLEKVTKLFLKEEGLTSKEKPTLSDMSQLNPSNSYGFLYLANMLHGPLHALARKDSTSDSSSASGKITSLLGTLFKGGAAAGLVAVAVAALPSLGKMIFEGKAIQNDPEINELRTAYLRTYTEAVYDKKSELIKGVGGELVAKASTYGSAVGEALGGLITAVASSIADVKTISNDPVIQENRAAFLREQAQLISNAKLDLYKEEVGSDGVSAGYIIAVSDVVGRSIGTIVGAAAEGIAESIFNIELLKSDPYIVKERQNFLQRQTDAILAAKIELYEEGEGSDWIAIADVAGRSVATLFGSAVEALAVSALNVADMATDDMLITKRRDFLSKQLDAIFAAQLDIYGTKDKPAAGYVVALFDLAGRSVASLTTGAIEALAVTALSVADMATDPVLISQRKAFLYNQLGAIYAAKEQLYGTSNNPSWLSKNLARAEYVGTVVANLLGGFTTALAGAAFDITILTTDPDFVKERKTFLMGQLRTMYALKRSVYGDTEVDEEGNVKGTRAGWASKAVAAFEGVGTVVGSLVGGFTSALASAAFDTAIIYTDETLVQKRKDYFADEIDALFAARAAVTSTPVVSRSVTNAIDTMLEKVFDFSKEDTAEIKNQAALKYALAVAGADVPRIVLSQGDKITAAVADAFKNSVESVRFDWSSVNANAKASLSTRYAGAVVSYYEEQLRQAKAVAPTTLTLQAINRALFSAEFSADVKLSSEDIESSAIKQVLATKYAEAIKDLNIGMSKDWLGREKTFDLPAVDDIAKNLAEALEKDAKNFTYSWDDVAPTMRETLATRYMTTITDFFGKQLDLLGGSSPINPTTTALREKLIAVSGITVNAPKLANTVYSDETTIDTRIFNLATDKVYLTAANLETEVEDATGLVMGRLSESMAVLSRSIDALAAVVEANPAGDTNINLNNVEGSPTISMPQMLLHQKQA